MQFWNFCYWIYEISSKKCFDLISKSSKLGILMDKKGFTISNSDSGIMKLSYA